MMISRRDRIIATAAAVAALIGAYILIVLALNALDSTYPKGRYLCESRGIAGQYVNTIPTDFGPGCVDGYSLEFVPFNYESDDFGN